MSQRRTLVIGSQCAALQPPLSFLPQAAQDLYAVLTDPERGACISAVEGEGLLIDPTVDQMKEAIRTAYWRAAKDEATLVIAYIGHGENADDDYYLLPRDGLSPPTSDTAVHLTNLIKEAHRKAPGRVDGLAVLVDACYSGVAGRSAAQAWVSGLKGTLRFDMLTAAADRPAADGCFSRTLATLLRDGVAEVPDEHLRSQHLRRRLQTFCPKQEPQNPSFSADETLWLGKNAGRVLEPWARTALADQIQRLTLVYQVTPALREIVAHSQAERCVAVLGVAGRGKSALAAALAWPVATQGVVPASFVQVVVLVTEATTPRELANTLSEQLRRSVLQFREAQEAFAKQTPYAELQRLGVLERHVVGPLQRLASASEVRFVVDGLDRLTTGARAAVMDVLNALIEVPFVRLIVTTQPETQLPEGASTYALAPAPSKSVAAYLERRTIDPVRHDEIITTAEGNWLVVRVLADLLSEHPEAEIHAGQLALRDAYEDLLARRGASDNEATQSVLSILAAAGPGPVLPLTLLRAASEKLGGAATHAGVRDELFRLRGLVDRSAAGTQDEHAGVFHQTLAKHMNDHAPQAVCAAHRALVDSIQSLAAEAESLVQLNDPVQRYAFEREAEHLWALGETDQALKCLKGRASAVPRDNLRRWRPWEARLADSHGVDHPYTLGTRYSSAHWTGQCGDARKALQLFEALLPDQMRVLGADHEETLETRKSIASWTGVCGNVRKALQLFEALLPDQMRVLGADHQYTFSTRNSIALLTGDVRKTLGLLEALLPDQVRVLGVDDPGTLTTRHNIAYWTGQCGDAREALRLLQELLPDQTRVLGADDVFTLTTTRHNIARWTDECGDARAALQLFKVLLSDQTRVLGADHPGPLRTRRNIATLTRKCGDGHEALRLLQELLPDQTRVLGGDDPGTLEIRDSIANYTGDCGDAREELRLLQELLPDQTRVLGADDPKTRRTRAIIAVLARECGE